MTMTDQDLTTEVITNLHRAGLSTELIASSLKVPATTVKAIVVQIRNTPQTVLDEELAEEVRSLASMAVREAKLMLEFGTSDTRLSIVKSMLNGLSKHVASSVGGEQEEARQAFTRVLESMKVVPELEPFVTQEGTQYVPIDTVSEDAGEDGPERSEHVPKGA